MAVTCGNVSWCSFHLQTASPNSSHEDDSDGDEIVSTLMPVADVIIGVYLTFLALVTFILNGVVLVTLAHQSKTLTPFQLQLGNLSLCGLATCCFSYPFPTLSSFNHGWAFGEQACLVDGCIVYLLALAAIAQLAIMALFRYYTTCQMEPGVTFSYPWLIVSLVCPYGFAMAWALPPLFGLGNYAIESAHLTCSLDWAAMTIPNIASVFTGVFIVPLCIMVCCYLRITHYLFTMQVCMERRMRRLDIHMAKMTAAMCFTFLATWTPYAVVSFYCACSDSNQLNPYLSIVTILLAKTSTISNPVVYFWSISSFRDDAASAVFIWKSQTERLHLRMLGQLTSQQTDSSSCRSGVSQSPQLHAKYQSVSMI